jgi:Domain of unknown function (DUF5666)
MRRRLFIVALTLGTMLALPLGQAASAQEAKQGAQETKKVEGKKAKAERLSGTVQSVNKDTKTILLEKNAGESAIQVVYSDQTKFTKDNKPATLEDVQNGRRLICRGMRNKDGQLEATRIEVRPMS